TGQPLAQTLPERLVAPVDIGGVVHDRLVGVDESGGRDARRDHLVAVADFRDEIDDDVDDRRRVTGRGGASLKTSDATGLVNESSGDLGSPDVDSDGVH